MRETRVFGRRICQIRQADLAQPAQTLKYRQVQEHRLGRIKFNEMRYGIEDPLHVLGLSDASSITPPHPAFCG